MNNFNFNLIDTSKGLGPFTYSWNQDGTLSGIQYPNNSLLNIIYSNKIQDNITLTKEGNTLFEANGEFDEKDRLTSEAIDITTPNGIISEDYSFSYDALSRLSSMNYSSDNRTITYGYDGSIGDRLTSVNFSDTGTYNITYDTKGRIDYVTYPNNQGTENYTYNDPKGRLTNITYPDGKSLSFSWNSRGKLTQLIAVEGGTTTSFAISYDGMNRISGYNKTTTEVGMPPQTEEWNFYYGITGIEKATRKQNGIRNLSMDFTVDMRGRILSTNYNEIGGYVGELFYVYDNLGNVCALTNNQGNIVTAYGYNVMNGTVENEFNPYSIENPFTFGGAIEIGNNDANVSPGRGSTFVVDPNISVVTLGKNVISLGTGCFSGAISDEMGRVISGPSFEEVNEALRELAQRDGFAMYCPGQTCATTPCSAIIDPEGCKEEDKMYPLTTGVEKEFKKGKIKTYSQCYKFCYAEYKQNISTALSKAGIPLTSLAGTTALRIYEGLAAGKTFTAAIAALGPFVLLIVIPVLFIIIYPSNRDYWNCATYCDKLLREKKVIYP